MTLKSGPCCLSELPCVWLRPSDFAVVIGFKELSSIVANERAAGGGGSGGNGGAGLGES